MPRSANENFWKASEYFDDWKETPVYHQDLAADLNVIFNTFSGGNLSVAQKRDLINRIKILYESEPYNRLNMWPVTRHWLSLQKDVNGVAISGFLP